MIDTIDELRPLLKHLLFTHLEAKVKDGQLQIRFDGELVAYCVLEPEKLWGTEHTPAVAWRPAERP